MNQDYKVCVNCNQEFAMDCNFCSRCGKKLSTVYNQSGSKITINQVVENNCSKIFITIESAPNTDVSVVDKREESTTGSFNSLQGGSDLPEIVLTNGSGKYYIDKPMVTIGRSNSSDIQVINPAVGRYHAIISNESGEYYLIDRQSKNHTYLNGKLLAPETRYRIHVGDEIVFANERFFADAQS